MFYKKLKCDGIAIDEIVKISKVAVQPVANISNASEENVSGGQTFLRQHRGSKVIHVEAVIPKNVFATIDRLNKIFTDKELVIELEEQPDRLYKTRFSKMSTPSSFVRNADITFEFEVFDGVAHAKSRKFFNFAKNANGILEADIVNDGNSDAFVDYEIKLKKESGFVGIVSQYGAQQFGKREEVDGVVEVKNVTLASNKGGNFANWTDGTTFFESQTKKSVTTMGFDTQIGGRLGVLPSSFTNSANGAQFGAIKEITLLQNSKNWYLWSRAMFETSRIDQTGSMCLAIVDTNNNLLAAMAIEKNTTTQNRAIVHFIMGDGQGGARAVKSIPFTPNSKIDLNPYGEESRATGRNMFDISKVGDKVTFFWYGSYYPYVESRIRDLEAKRIQYFVGQYAGQPSNKLVARTYINDLSFQKVGVENWVDIPNRYQPGSQLDIIGSEGRLYVDNKIAENDEILGTRYFKVPPGTTKVDLIVSSFSEVDTAKAYIEEEWT